MGAVISRGGFMRQLLSMNSTLLQLFVHDFYGSTL